MEQDVRPDILRPALDANLQLEEPLRVLAGEEDRKEGDQRDDVREVVEDVDDRDVRDGEEPADEDLPAAATLGIVVDAETSSQSTG